MTSGWDSGLDAAGRLNRDITAAWCGERTLVQTPDHLPFKSTGSQISMQDTIDINPTAFSMASDPAALAAEDAAAAEAKVIFQRAYKVLISCPFP